jgi:hypothetical protein
MERWHLSSSGSSSRQKDLFDETVARATRLAAGLAFLPFPAYMRC